MCNGTLKTNRFWFGLLAAALTLVLAEPLDNNLHQIALAQEQRRPVPFALFDRPEIRDPAERALREIRDKHYERFTFGLPSLDQLGGGETTECYAPGVREKLTVEKDTVLTGGVLDAHAYLNATKQHVYTEYRVLVEQILKKQGDAQLSPGKEITINRWGGGTQFPLEKSASIWFAI